MRRSLLRDVHYSIAQVTQKYGFLVSLKIQKDSALQCVEMAEVANA